MIGTMVKIIDPDKDIYILTDQSIKRLVVNHNGILEVLIIKFSEKALIKSLQKIQASFEVIIFTIIPKRFLDLIIGRVP